MAAAAKGKGGKQRLKQQQPAECWFVVLCGVPGSGKTTFGRQLEARRWVRASQDELGTQDEVRKLIEKSLRHRRSVLLDRCCVHAKERRMWLQLARGVPQPLHVEAVHFATPVECCRQRVVARVGHPNLQGPGSDAVVDDFARGFEPPLPREGFSAVHTVATPEEVAALLRVFAARPVVA